MKEVILTGLRVNDDLHLGHALGVFPAISKMQQQYGQTHQINMFIPDLHSITTPVDYSVLQKNSLNNLKYYVAGGLDIDNPNTFIYRQSYISAHSELTWLLDCFTGFGEAARMTQFKEKASNFLDGKIPESLKRDNEIWDSVHGNISVGLFNYPILMAADILLYGAKWVPVGEDQFQHLELTRDIGIRMNNKFGDLFVVPEPTKKQIEFMGLKDGVRIRDLVEPTRKMSKSVGGPKSKITLSDTPDEARQKVMSATTDSLAEINFDWQKQPGISNLLQMLALLTGQKLDDAVAEWQGQTQYGEFKQTVAQAVFDWLNDFQARLAQVDEAKLISKLEQSEEMMRKQANQTLLKVQKAVGLRR